MAASFQLLKVCAFVSDSVDVHNPLPPRRPDDLSEFLAQTLAEMDAVPPWIVEHNVAVMREVRRLQERVSIEWSIDRYNQAVAAMRSGAQPEDFDRVQLFLLSAVAFADFDAAGEVARMFAEAPDDAQLLLVAKAIAEAAGGADPTRRGQLELGEECFLMLRAHRLLTSRAVAAVLDETSEAELHHYLSQGVLRQGALRVTDAGRALSIAPLYVLRAVPHLAELDVGLLIDWREELADSLSAYRSAVVEISTAASGVDRADTDAFLASVGPHLDRLYAEVSRHAEASRLWSVTRERSASFVGPAVPAGIVLAAAPHQPVAALSALAAGTLTQALVTVVEALRRIKNTSAHPLYWRYALNAAPSS
jgi:hypothetical protein